MAKSQVLFVMGVSGSGKSTVGKLLSEKLNFPFFDGDSFHPEANIKKMSEGKPLNDDDRQGWLERLNEVAIENTPTGAVIVCSALKERYRTILGDNLKGQHQFIYLDGSFELINKRLSERKNHYMPKGLLKSQFDTLEVPTDVLTVSIDQSPTEIVDEIIKKL
ncbi:gluconokinase [uncultured Maribacter sp.]|uniref:gluconokinase n=1 Tax=uncultured Maribacter sp. TaxID=431308 RepID=UPI0030ED33A1|tara:strand:- start:58583 stop:59071 length:489 start_codon:yes stop_codon:yes gene_type:complete